MVERLAEGLSPFGKRDPELPARAARFVVSGEGPAVLLELANLATQPIHAFAVAAFSGVRGLPGTQTSHLATLAALLQDESFAEPERLYRLGQALAAPFPKPLPGYSFGGSERCPDWFRALMSVAATLSKHHAPATKDAERGSIAVERALAALALDGAGATELLDYLCVGGPSSSAAYPMPPRQIPGLGAFLANDSARVAEAAAVLDAEGRTRLCMLLHSNDAVPPNLSTVVGLAVGSAKVVRAAAVRALAGTEPAALRTAIAGVLDAKSIEPKIHAVALLAQAFGPDARPLLEAQLAARPAKKLADAIVLNLAALGGAQDASGGQTDDEPTRYRAVGGTVIDIPPLPPAQPEAPFPADLRGPLLAAVELFNTAHRALQQKYRTGRLEVVILEPRVVDDFIATANGTAVDALRDLGSLCRVDSTSPCGRALQAMLADPRVTLRHLLRLYQVGGGWPPGKLPPLYRAYEGALSLIFRKRMLAEAGDLRELVALHAAIGCTQEELARDVFAFQAWEEVSPARAPFVWPFLAGQSELFEEALGVRPLPRNAAKVSLERALAALELLPKAPQRLLLPLMREAVTGTNAQRRRARALIAGAPDLDASIAGLLTDGKSETRADAAQWLAERNARDCIARIREALHKERVDKTRASLLRALAALGDDIAPFVGETTLLAEAQAGLRKTGTKGLEWFPFEQLPALHWASGAAVSPEIIRWWVVLANKLKEPGGHPLFDVYLDRLAPNDPAKLGAFVLAAFIERDTQRPAESEAIAYADERVDSQLAAILRYVKDMRRETVYARLKNEFLAQYLNSAAENRGILALATRIPGPDAPGKVRAYLKNHGGRTSQAKALLSCLAGNPNDAAIQVVLATANRFKQRTVQEHAAALVQSIADARGWTPDELADNTIPTAGLDASGSLELDCGDGRAFAAVLGATGKLELRTPLGKPAKALPSPRTADDGEPLAEAKRALASAKKELAQVLDMQTGRLYEAMCLERTWRTAEWERLLLGHPIVRLLCRRLVWLALDAGHAVIASFRPLEDGTFSGPADERVDLGGITAVKLAHRAIVAPEVADAWTTHLADYEVEPPFGQFSRPVLGPSAGDAAAECIRDRRGWMIEALKLRGAAAKRGYQAGPAQDGGVFMEYVRRHPGAALQIEIGFTGSWAGQENSPVALTDLSFIRLGRGATEPLSLADVPPVLLSEALNDYREIAAAGSGFDPQWMKKSEA